MLRQRRTFLQQDNWMSVPWASSAKQKSLPQQFLDIVCFIPGLWEERNSLLSPLNRPMTTTDEKIADSRTSEISGRIYGIIDAIQEWQSEWANLYPRNHRTVSCENLVDYPEHLFGPPLRFANLDRCREFTKYNGALYELFKIQSLLDDSAAQSPTASSTHQTSKTFAAEICRCVPYMLDFHENGSGGAMLTLWWFRIISSTYTTESEELAWIVRTIDVCRKMGMEGGDIVGEDRVQELSDSD